MSQSAVAASVVLLALLASSCAAGPAASELARARRWVDLCLPSTPVAAQPPSPGLHITLASNKVLLRKTVWGGTLNPGGQRCEHGLYMDAPAQLLVVLSKPAARLTALVGIDDNPDSRIGAAKGEGSATFHVLAGDRELYRSDVLTLKNSPAPLDVPLAGLTEFTLRVDVAGRRDYDQSDWGDAKVTFADGTSAYLDELGFSVEPETQIPFSFTFDGKPSAQLLPGWQRTATDRALDADRTERTIRYKDPASGLVCEAVATIYRDHPAVEWVLRFRNEGAADTPVLQDINTLDARWPIAVGEPVTVRRSLGSSALPTDFQPITEALPDGQSVAFGPSGGRSSNGALPFYTLQWPGGGVCVGLGWSGQWQAKIARTGGLRLQTGLELVHTTLHPGEEIRSARVLLVFWQGDDHQRGHNLYRQTVIAHYMPRVHGQLAYPICAHNTAWDELHNANERNQLEIFHAAEKCGVEGFWIDAYWFEGYFPGGVGNWAIPIEQTERRKDYPHGVRHISDEVHKRGLKFILWFEPERVAPGTHIDRTYPQWVLRVNDGPGGLFNLGDPDARKWMTDYLCQCIEAYKLDVLRIDFNMDPLPFWRAADAPDRQGLTEIRYITGLYQMWDDILARFPGIFIDNCASGGRRIDLETNRRSLPMWRSDYDDDNVRRGNPIAEQGMTMGLSAFMPLNTGPVWHPDPYHWRSSNVGGPIPYWDPRAKDYSAEEARAAIRETQELRPYLLGDLWLLTANTTDPSAWAAWQYHRGAEDDGFAYLFRRDRSPYPMLEVPLRGVSPERKYTVEYRYGYATDKTVTMTGKELQKLRVEIPKRGGSLLVKYKVVWK